jgi:hypothetical protein
MTSERCDWQKVDSVDVKLFDNLVDRFSHKKWAFSLVGGYSLFLIHSKEIV